VVTLSPAVRRPIAILDLVSSVVALASSVCAFASSTSAAALLSTAAVCTVNSLVEIFRFCGRLGTERCRLSLQQFGFGVETSHARFAFFLLLRSPGVQLLQFGRSLGRVKAGFRLSFQQGEFVRFAAWKLQPTAADWQMEEQARKKLELRVLG
jgi:hypothetical protein